MSNTSIVRKLCDTDGWVSGITVNFGYVYYTTDNENVYRVRQDNTNEESHIVMHIKGARLHGIVWHNNSLYICDWRNHVIISYSLDTGCFFTVAGNGNEGHKEGTCMDAEFCYPWGIAVDRNDNLYFTDKHNVWKINLSARTANIIAGSTSGYGSGGHLDGDAMSAKFNYPFGLTMGSDGTIYVADRLNHCIRQIKNGIVFTVTGIPGKEGSQDGPPSKALENYPPPRFNHPCGLVLDGDGSLLVVDKNGLRTIDMVTNLVSTLKGIPAGQIVSIAIDFLKQIYIGKDKKLIKITKLSNSTKQTQNSAYLLQESILTPNKNEISGQQMDSLNAELMETQRDLKIALASKDELEHLHNQLKADHRELFRTFQTMKELLVQEQDKNSALIKEKMKLSKLVNQQTANEKVMIRTIQTMQQHNQVLLAENQKLKEETRRQIF